MKQGGGLLKMLSEMYSLNLKKESLYPGQATLDRDRVYKFRDPSKMMPLYGIGGLRK